MPPHDQVFILQQQLGVILAEMQTYPSRYDGPTRLTAASSAVKYTLQQLTPFLPPALQASVQAILDQHDALWGLFRTVPQESVVSLGVEEVVA